LVLVLVWLLVLGTISIEIMWFWHHSTVYSYYPLP